MNILRWDESSPAQRRNAVIFGKPRAQTIAGPASLFPIALFATVSRFGSFFLGGLVLTFLSHSQRRAAA